LQRTNGSACRLFGLDPSRLASGILACFELYDVAGVLLDRTQHPLAIGARSGRPVHDAIWGFRRPEGTMQWFSSNASLMMDPSGAFTGVVHSVADITERHDARRELERAHGRYAALVERSTDMICVVGLDGVVHCASPAYPACSTRIRIKG
jgi:PAS domain S-box-containing protein